MNPDRFREAGNPVRPVVRWKPVGDAAVLEALAAVVMSIVSPVDDPTGPLPPAPHERSAPP
jgi:hypothetical protein